MKVLEEPTGPLVRSYTFRCSNMRCKAKLQASEHEGKYHDDQRDGDAFEFKCPRCNITTWVDAKLYDGR